MNRLFRYFTFLEEDKSLRKCALKIQRAHFFEELFQRTFTNTERDDLWAENTSLHINACLLFLRHIKNSFPHRYINPAMFIMLRCAADVHHEFCNDTTIFLSTTVIHQLMLSATFVFTVVMTNCIWIIDNSSRVSVKASRRVMWMKNVYCHWHKQALRVKFSTWQISFGGMYQILIEFSGFSWGNYIS